MKKFFFLCLLGVSQIGAEFSVNSDVAWLAGISAVNAGLYKAREAVEVYSTSDAVIKKWGSCNAYDLKFRDLFTSLFTHTNYDHLESNAAALASIAALRFMGEYSGKLPLVKPYIGIGLASGLFECFLTDGKKFCSASNSIIGLGLYTAYWELVNRGPTLNFICQLMFAGQCIGTHQYALPATALYIALEKFLFKKSYELKKQNNDLRPFSELEFKKYMGRVLRVGVQASIILGGIKSFVDAYETQ